MDEGYHAVELDSGRRMPARTIVLATGASYRRLGVPRLSTTRAWASTTRPRRSRLAVDDHGFVATGQDLQLTHVDPAGDGRQRPPSLLETSRPGVFGVRDVRAASIKRVASAVGEGAMTVRLIHQYLALTDGARAAKARTHRSAGHGGDIPAVERIFA